MRELKVARDGAAPASRPQQVMDSGGDCLCGMRNQHLLHRGVYCLTFWQEKLREAVKIDAWASLASGQYSGPLDGYSGFDHAKDIVESRRLLANLLDNVSAEEKATSTWASIRQEAGLFSPQSKVDSNATKLGKLLTMFS